MRYWLSELTSARTRDSKHLVCDNCVSS